MSSESLYIGNYRIVKELSGGTFGDVYLAQHLVLTNRIVAIKLLRSIHLESDQAITRFLREAQFLEKLKHPHILPVIDVGIYKNFPYMVTEYASKGSLRDRINRRVPALLPFQESLTILAQVGQALQYAHQQNVIHRDIKPENILFNDNDEVLLADFGLATVVDSSSLKHTGSTGTITYMAPEQFHDTICKESDQYALACIAYELFTGHQPFEASNIASFIAKCLLEEPEPLRKYNPQIALNTEQIILKALSKERTQRYENIMAFIEALKSSTFSLLEEEKVQWIEVMIEKISSNLISKEMIVRECDKILQVDSTFTAAFYFKGVAFNDLKKYEEALVAFDNFIDKDPYYSLAWFYKSDILRCMGMNEAARAAYITGKHLEEIEQRKINKNELQNEEIKNKDLNSESDISEADKYYSIGKAFFQGKNYVDALSSLELATTFSPNHVAAWNQKGFTYLVLGQCEKALEAFTKIIQVDPYNLDAYRSTAMVYGIMKQYDTALEVLNIAIKIDPNYLPTYSLKAAVLSELNRYHEALALYEKCINLNPGNADFWHGKGLVLENLGQLEEALIAQNQAIRLDGTCTEAYTSKVDLLANLDRIPEALDTVNQALQLSPDDSEIYENKTSLLLRIKHYEEAFYASECALRLAPNSSEAHWLNGWASYSLHQKHAAFNAFDKAIQLNPGEARYWEGKGMVLQELGRIQEANMAYEVANKLSK